MIRCCVFMIALSLAVWSPARAATFCVTNGSQLVAALGIARANGQHDLIKIAKGFYAHPTPGGTFAYQPDVNSGETFDIELSGGWSEFFGNPCGQRLDSDNAFSTVLVGSANSTTMSMSMSISGSENDFILSRITFLGGAYGLNIRAVEAYGGTMRVDQCAFLDQTGDDGAGLRMVAGDHGTIRLRNSLFDGIDSIGEHAAWLVAFPGGGIYATNNTFVNNTADGTDAALRITTGTSAQSLVANNNLWGNEGADLVLDGPGTLLRHNNIGTRVGSVPAENIGNISVAPVYESGSLNYTPAVGSPLRDSGILPPAVVPIPPPFYANWATGTQDIRGQQRVRGATIDIGAYESDGDRLFADGFDQPDM